MRWRPNRSAAFTPQSSVMLPEEELPAISAEASHEIEGPMAVVILGGLATSATLNLLVLPTLALRFGRVGLPHDVSGAPR